MPQFFFNFREASKVAVDPEGCEFDSLEAAYLDAFEAAKEMWSVLLFQNRDPRRCGFDIADQSGAILMQLPFLEVFDGCAEKADDVARKHRQVHRDVQATTERMRDLASELRAEMVRTRATLDATRELLRRHVP